MEVKKIFAWVLFSLIYAPAFSQITVGIEAKTYSYEESPKLSELQASDTAYSDVIITDKIINELYFTDQYGSESIGQELLFTFKTYHRRVRLNNDDAVQAYNKMYISMGGYKNLLDIKARSINPDGSVTEFNKDNMKFIENFQNAGPYNILALEGVQVGAEVEYIYTIQYLDNDLYGHIYVQGESPKKEFSYELIYPDKFEFLAKSYNGGPEMVLDTLNKDRLRLKVSAKDIKAHKEEEMSAGDATIQRIEFKLEANEYSGKSNIHSWKNASEAYTKNLYNEVEDTKTAKKERKALAKMAKKDLGLKIGSPDKEVIYAIEQYIKSDLRISDDGGKRLFHEIKEAKMLTEFAALRLYIRLLEYYGIEHQLVLTSSRFSKTFDGDFETYNFFEKYLLYFPQLDQFTDASASNYRIGLVPYGYCYHKGLFFKSKEIGGVKAFFPEIKEIPGTAYDQSYDNMDATIVFDDEFEKCKVNLKKETLGYNAAFLRPFFPLLTPDQKKEVLESSLQLTGEDTKVITYETKGLEMFGSMLDHPFFIEGQIEMDHLIEKAGANYLFKIGQIIGPQMEMYKSEDRKFAVETHYNHSYKRILRFTIPDGFQVKNLKDLNMDFYSAVEGKRTMEFVSSYDLQGNTLTVTVNEFYNEIRIPVERYEEYRTVINAAADFNKIVLVLEKK